MPGSQGIDATPKIGNGQPHASTGHTPQASGGSTPQASGGSTPQVSAGSVTTQSLSERVKAALPEKEYKPENFSRYSEKAKSSPIYEGSGATYAFKAEGAAAERAGVLNEIASNLRINESMQESHARTLEFLGSGRESKDFERMIKHEARDFKRSAQGFVRAAQDSLKSHADAIGALEKDTLETLKALKSEHIETLANINKATGSVPINGVVFEIPNPEAKNKLIAEVQSVFENQLGELNKFKMKQLDIHFDAINEIKEVTRNVAEKTGVDASKVLNFELNQAAKVAAKEEGALAKFMDKAVGDATKNGEKQKWGAVKVVKLGGAAVLGVDGARRLVSGEGTSTDKVIGAAELAGGGLLTWSALAKKAAAVANVAAHAR